MKVGKRHIQDGSQFAQYYTKPAFNDVTVIPKGTVNDTCLKIKELIPRWKHQTERITKILQLKAGDRKTTAYTLWYYYFTYFQYNEDRAGVEQLRSPRRAFWDGVVMGNKAADSGIDCDCFALSILTMCSNIGLEAYAKIIQRTNDTDYSHIYVVIPKEAGKVNWDDKKTYWTVDPVVHEFNKEVPDIKTYKIYAMNGNKALNGLSGVDIQTLDGLGSIAANPLAKYPRQAYDFLKILENCQGNEAKFKKEVQAAIAFENKWRSMGLIGQHDVFFTNLAITGLNGLGSFRSFLKNIGSDIKTTVKASADAVTSDKTSHIAAGAIFLGAREAFKQILKENVLGFATIIGYYQRTNTTKYNNILDIWYKYGGDRATMALFINEGKTKKPRQVAPAVFNKFSAIKGLVEKANDIYYNKSGVSGLGAVGWDDAAEAITTIGVGWALIKDVLSTFKGDKTTDPTIANTSVPPPGGNLPPPDNTPPKSGMSAGLKTALAATVAIGIKLILF